MKFFWSPSPAPPLGAFLAAAAWMAARARATTSTARRALAILALSAKELEITGVGDEGVRLGHYKGERRSRKAEHSWREVNGGR